ncbi:creatininase family protein [Candidatus Bathyarchaeota archaeon]|nr:creatininase family protein [Candidatus Bathyarchaeota archaeon]
MRKVFIGDMTREEFRKMMETARVAVIPTGSTEQHGPHLPMKTDLAIVTYVVSKAAEELYPQVIVVPPIAIGYSPYHLCYPGTISLRHETLIEIVMDICRSLRHHGFLKIAIVNGHGGNGAPSQLAARRAREELGLKMVVVSYWSLIPREILDAVLETKIVPGHACEFETSIGYVVFPNLISSDVPKRRKPPSILPGFVWNIDELTTNGYEGDPSLATKEKGEKLIQAAVEGLKSLLQEFINL